MSCDLANLRVLVVEDDVMISMLIEDMLTDLGCRIVGPAARSQEALALLRDIEIDCAILDINLGGDPVNPVADLLRERGVPFAFATGYGEGGLRDIDRDVSILQKPFGQAQLVQTLRSLKALVVRAI